MSENTFSIQKQLSAAFQKRSGLFGDPQITAYRMFNGFCEGCRDFCIDRYGDTAVILWSQKTREPKDEEKDLLVKTCLEHIPGVNNVLYKNRYSRLETEKKGVLLAGKSPAHSICEWGIRYPLDLQLNKDCGFYLDSAMLRKWLLENAAGKRVLNTFAYTGSLGDAAEAGKALSVTQTDLNRNYLSARHSTQEYIFGDFFHVAASLRRSDRLFDIILLDPPFFANADRSAKVDQAKNAAALVNKVRPLAAHRGKIIVVNNALFLSGKDFLSQMECLCGEFLSIGEIIPVPESFYGFGTVEDSSLPADPAPFNHSTKILILDVHRKDERA